MSSGGGTLCRSPCPELAQHVLQKGKISSSPAPTPGACAPSRSTNKGNISPCLPLLTCSTSKIGDSFHLLLSQEAVFLRGSRLETPHKLPPLFSEPPAQPSAPM